MEEASRTLPCSPLNPAQGTHARYASTASAPQMPIDAADVTQILQQTPYIYNSPGTNELMDPDYANKFEVQSISYKK